MNLADCYRLLELDVDAKLEQIKASYRRLARTYHPDANPGNPEEAHAKFIQLTEAYKSLLQVAAQAQQRSVSPKSVVRPTPRAKRPPSSPPSIPKLSPQDQQLKSNSFQLLQSLLSEKRFARAIALVEGLAYRFPFDPEIRQWQAIAYQQWGRQLIRDRAFDKAQIYLKKALRTDPRNRSLAAEVESDLRRLERETENFGF